MPDINVYTLDFAYATKDNREIVSKARFHGTHADLRRILDAAEAQSLTVAMMTTVMAADADTTLDRIGEIAEDSRQLERNAQ